MLENETNYAKHILTFLQSNIYQYAYINISFVSFKLFKNYAVSEVGDKLSI